MEVEEVPDPDDVGLVLEPTELSKPHIKEEGKQTEENETPAPQSKEYYLQKYKQDWEEIPQLRDWLRPVPGDIYKAWCAYCKTTLRCHKQKLYQHTTSAKHRSHAVSSQGGRRVDQPSRHQLSPRRGRMTLGRRAGPRGFGGRTRPQPSEPKECNVEVEVGTNDVSYSDTSRVTYSIGLGGNKVGFIGAGNIAQAVCLAILDKGVIHPSSVMVAAPTSAHLSVWSGWGATVAPSNDAVLRDCDLVLLAVPAEKAEAVLEALVPPAAEQRTSRDRCLISLVPGLSRETIETIMLPKFAAVAGSEEPAGSAGSLYVVRCMLSLAARVGAGCCAFSAPDRLPSRWLLQLEVVLGAMGASERLSDSQLEPFAAAFGAGPALAGVFADALSQAAASCGLPWTLVRRMTAQTLVGAGHLLAETSRASPCGDDAAPPGSGALDALITLNQSGIRGGVVSAVQAYLRRLRPANPAQQ